MQQIVTNKNTVKIKTQNGEIKTIKFVFNSNEIDPQNGIISVDSPLAKAIIGAQINEKRTYKVNGKEFEIEILEII